MILNVFDIFKSLYVKLMKNPILNFNYIYQELKLLSNINRNKTYIFRKYQVFIIAQYLLKYFEVIFVFRK